MKYCLLCGRDYLVFKQCKCSDNIEDYMVQIGTLTFREDNEK